MTYEPKAKRQLTPGWRAELEGWLESGMDVIAHYGIDQSKTVYEAMDNAFWTWLHAQDEAGAPPSDIVLTGLGAILGNRIVANSSFEWVLIEDEEGEALALEQGSTLLFPFDFVAKRVMGQAEASPDLFSSFMDYLGETYPAAFSGG